MVCITGLLSTTWPHFQSFPSLYTGSENKLEASTMSNKANLVVNSRDYLVGKKLSVGYIAVISLHTIGSAKSDM